MQRWLVLTFGLGLAAVAGYVLLSGVPVPRGSGSRPAAVSPGGGAREEPRDHIDADSRAALQKILREADREPGERP